MIGLLQNKYAAAHGSTRIPAVRHEVCNDADFCIMDKKAHIVCASLDDGVGVYDNNSKRYGITIIDFEKFVNEFKPSTAAGRGKKCDFILYDNQEAYVILNELSELDAKYLEGHEVYGENKEGKRSHAIRQIQESIDKLVVSSDIRSYMDRKARRIGLFSYRINEDDSIPKEIQQSMTKFGMVKNSFSNVSAPIFSNGFVFEQRIYPTPFKLE